MAQILQREHAGARRLKIWKRILILVAASAFITAGSRVYLRWARSESHRVAVLASAAPPQRPFAGRLATFPYRPLVHAVRGATKASVFEEPQGLAFSIACDRVIGGARPVSSADHHLTGICALFAGATDEAVGSLERSLVIATGVRDPARASEVSSDIALLTDLSTAYLERGSTKQRAADYIRALNCSDRAWRLSQTPETRWNRALSLQRLHLNDDAREAWQAYLQTTREPQWELEARTRLKETKASPESNLWLRDGGRLLELPPAQLERLSRMFPLQARRAAEKEILPAWSAAVLSGNHDVAEAWLQILATIGATLEKQSGESLSYDVASKIRAAANDPAATHRLAEAVATVAEAKKAYDEGNGPECRAKLRAAIPQLLRYENPLVYYARFYIASSYYFDNDYASLRREAAALSDIPTRYIALHAQTKWILGLGEMSVGRPDAALVHYQAALATFEQLGESDYVAAVHNLLAEAYEYLDSGDEAWAHREHALELVNRIGPSSSQFVQLLQGSARLLLATGQPAVAKILLDRTLKLPATAADPLLMEETISWQAVALHQLGRSAEANATWKHASDAASNIRVPALRDRALNDVTLTRALTLEHGITPEDVESAVAFARNSDNRWALPQMLRLQADVRSRQGAYEQAMNGYTAAIDEILDQRRKTSIARFELLNRSCLSDVTDHALSLAMNRGDYDSAFRFSEHSAGAAFRDMPPEPKPQMPANVAIVEIVCLSNRMLIRTITAHGVHDRQVAVSIETVRNAADDLADGAHPETAVLLGSMIIAPDVIGPAVDTLVFVPDASVATVPFAAVIDPATHKPLIERYVVAQDPTVGSYLRAATFAATPAVGQPLLVDAAEPGDLPRLPEAIEEIRGLRRLYPSANVWSDADAISTLPAALRNAGLIHFAAHVIVDRANERLSKLILGAGDKILYAHEAEELGLSRHPIVVLSTCSGAATARLRRRRAPTFADAFLAAGAAAIVASSEPIDDERARQLSMALHERLRHGVPVGRAVREIQLAFAREGRPWSDLVIVGNPAATFRPAPNVPLISERRP